MKGYIFIDDFIEIYIKIVQRGLPFILSKLNLDKNKRTISAFDGQFVHANWWILEKLRNRQNFLISGNKAENYESYISKKYFATKEHKTLISIGCGAGNHEMSIAKLNPEMSIIGYDIAATLIDGANQKAQELGLVNAKFVTDDLYKINFEAQSIDVFLFNAALHHIKNIDSYVKDFLLPALKPNGLIIINEYVGPNRLKYSPQQVAFCNNILKNMIPRSKRRILGTNLYKTKIYRHGLLRMIISDPSECVDSEAILPVLDKYLIKLELLPLGGNIIMPTLKHIAHNFIQDETHILDQIIEAENEYLKTNDSDFSFGVYRKPEISK